MKLIVAKFLLTIGIAGILGASIAGAACTWGCRIGLNASLFVMPPVVGQPPYIRCAIFDPFGNMKTNDFNYAQHANMNGWKNGTTPYYTTNSSSCTSTCGGVVGYPHEASYASFDYYAAAGPFNAQSYTCYEDDEED